MAVFSANKVSETAKARSQIPLQIPAGRNSTSAKVIQNLMKWFTYILSRRGS